MNWRLLVAATALISMNVTGTYGTDTMECVPKKCLSSPSKAFGSCEGFKALVSCVKKCPATESGSDAWSWTVSDAHGPWNHVVKYMMAKCGMKATSGHHVCLPEKPTEIFEHCWQFNTYQECVKSHGIEEPDNSTWSYLTKKMSKKCQPQLEAMRNLPRLKINVTKMASILDNIAKPSDWNACENFHAFTCEHSLRRPDRPKRSISMESKDEPEHFGVTDITEVDALLKEKVTSMLEDVAAGKEWTGPSWVFKLLVVYNACSDNETAHFCVLGQHPRATPESAREYIFMMLKLYAAEMQPGYSEARDFVIALLPLVRQEMAKMVKEWAGLGNTTKLVDFIENQLPIYIGLAPKFHQYMTAMTSNLKVFNNSRHTMYSFSAWRKHLSGLDHLVYSSGSYLVWNAFANGWHTPNAFFGGTLLVPPAFDLDLSYAFLFGDTLFVLFHELSHALEGAMVLVKDAKTSFYSYFKQCLIDEYSQHPIYFNGTKKLNGSFTYSENFADVFGFQLTWRLYQKYYKVFDLVPGKRFNKDQVFFVGMSANAVLCRKGLDDLEKAEKMQGWDPHTRGENRLNIMMMHSPQFAREFDCAVGTKMNPYKNCIKLLNIDNY